MFLPAVDEGSVGLVVVGGVAVEAEDLVDGVGCEVRRRGRQSLRDLLTKTMTTRHCLGKEVTQGLREVCQLDVVLSEYLLQRFGEGGVVGEGDGERE